MSLFGTRKYYPRGESYRKVLLEIISLGLHDSYANSPNKFDEPYTKEIGTKYAYKLLKKVEVKSIGNTNVLEITYSSVFPDEARRIADMIALVYKDLEKSIGNEDASLTVEFMQELVKKQESELSLAEEAIKQFKITNNIYDLEGNAGLLTNQISTIESEVYNTISEINIRKEQISFLSSKISENQKSLATKISNDINAQLVVLRSEITQIESQLIQNTMLYGVDHGAVVELKNRLSGLKEKLNEKLDALISRGITVSDPLQERQETISEIIALEAQIFGFNLKKEEAEKLREIYNLKLLTLPDKQLQLARLKRDEIVLTENYSMLRQKLEEAKIKLISQGGRVQILDKANGFREDWNGFNVLHNTASSVASLEILSKFCDFQHKEIDDNCTKGEIKFLYLLGVDEVDYDYHGAFIVYQGHHGDVGAQKADVVLPGAAYTEKSGIYLNLEGRLQVSERAVYPPGEAKDDWSIIRALSESIDYKIDFNNIEEVRDSLIEEIPLINSFQQEKFNSKPIYKKIKNLKSVDLKFIDRQFFMTCPISRTSVTMAECIKKSKG